MKRIEKQKLLMIILYCGFSIHCMARGAETTKAYLQDHRKVMMSRRCEHYKAEVRRERCIKRMGAELLAQR